MVKSVAAKRLLPDVSRRMNDLKISNYFKQIFDKETGNETASKSEDNNAVRDTSDTQDTPVTDKVKMDITERDKNKVWAFCSGNYSNDFRGNPKWLFVYINKYRKDISAYWLCDNDEVIEQVRSLGFRAYKLGTLAAEQAIDRTGVLVSEQVKMSLPNGLENAKYLNLWHGVGGVKAVERSLTTGFLAEQLAKKYIDKNAYYRTHELYLAPSKFIEDIAIEQLGLDEGKIIRAGYPRCIYQSKFEKIETFNHDIISQRGLPDDTKIAAYTPTYRNDREGELFADAIPDMERLISVCEKEHILFIFKMHPLLESEMSFLKAKETYGNCPYLYFWDNKDDFYEILDKIDLCIMDYSSIFTDFIAVGTKHFIRYTFDFDPKTLDFPMDYDEVTPGRKCENFEQLLQALSTYEQDDIEADIERIRKQYWEYDSDDSMDKIIDQTIAFVPEEKEFHNLYSFDVFDTLITRKVLDPIGIFYYVKQKMQESNLAFPEYLIKRYPAVRKNAELNMREYYNRSKVERDDERCEIGFDEIFERLKTLYSLSDEQVSCLKEWELEAEYENTIPIKDRVDYVKELLSKGETVVLISDMYLPKDFVTKLLKKCDPVLAELPLYLSSDLGYEKEKKTLFLEVYRNYGSNYNFKKWIHTGDNLRSDRSMPMSLNIKINFVPRLSFNHFEKSLVNFVNSYDGYLVAGAMARFRQENPSNKAQFAYSFISLLFVPYVRWALRSAVENKDEIVYFISRDGHQLKRIADKVAEIENLDIERKYIYASRRVWRVPSFFDHIDVGFWGQGYGNFAKVDRYDKLLKALEMDESTFNEIFPFLAGSIDKDEEITPQQIKALTEIFKTSQKYLDYLLNIAKEKRVATCGYLEQEIDKNKQFSIIEYWGRGYTQENFTRLWQHIVGKEVPVTFYYSRSTLPSDEWNIRKNYIARPESQQFIESIFACIPYKSVESYEKIDGKWVPQTSPIECDYELFSCMEKYLPLFAEEFCTAPFLDRDMLGRELIDFAIYYYKNFQGAEMFTDILANLVDSVELYGTKKEYAGMLTEENLEELKTGKLRSQISKSFVMSLKKAPHDVFDKYMDMYQIRPGEALMSGTLLTDEEVELSKEFQNKLDKLKQNAAVLRGLYNDAVSKYPIQDKILVLTDAKKFGKEDYRSLFKALDEQNVFSVRKLSTSDKTLSQKELMQEVATARYILCFHPLTKLSGIELRKGTEMIVLTDSPVQYFAKGLAVKYKIRTEREFAYLKLMSDISYITAPSENAPDSYKKIYKMNNRTDFIPTGSCQTDIYFDTHYKALLRDKLNSIFPQANGKKVICYIPYHRYRREECSYAQLLDMKYMQEKLGDEYVVIMHKQAKYKGMSANSGEVKGFSVDLTKKMSIRSQMMVADIIIGDYRDSVFESPLLNVPVFMSSWDSEYIDRTKNTFCDFDDLAYGVPIKNTDDLIDKIENIESYDYGVLEKFREEYLTYCDGNSSKKLVDFIIADAQKQEPEISIDQLLI